MMKETRIQLGWSQQQMADALGIKRPYLCEMETGRKPVSKRTELALMWVRHKNGLATPEHAEA